MSFSRSPKWCTGNTICDTIYENAFFILRRQNLTTLFIPIDYYMYVHRCRFLATVAAPVCAYKSKHNNSSEKCSLYVCAYLFVRSHATRHGKNERRFQRHLCSPSQTHIMVHLNCFAAYAFHAHLSHLYFVFVVVVVCILRSKLHKSECKRERKRHTQTDICLAHIYINRRWQERICSPTQIWSRSFR